MEKKDSKNEFKLKLKNITELEEVKPICKYCGEELPDMEFVGQSVVCSNCGKVVFYE